MAGKPAGWHDSARRELIDEARYYEEVAERGSDFRRSVGESVKRICEQPGSGTPRRRVRGILIRRLRVKAYPFYVVYGDLDDSVRVYAIAHDKRRPDYWIRRVGT